MEKTRLHDVTTARVLKSLWTQVTRKFVVPSCQSMLLARKPIWQRIRRSRRIRLVRARIQDHLSVAYRRENPEVEFGISRPPRHVSSSSQGPIGHRAPSPA